MIKTFKEWLLETQEYEIEEMKNHYKKLAESYNNTQEWINWFNEDLDKLNMEYKEFCQENSIVYNFSIKSFKLPPFISDTKRKMNAWNNMFA